jgi:hypothetical protein
MAILRPSAAASAPNNRYLPVVQNAYHNIGLRLEHLVVDKTRNLIECYNALAGVKSNSLTPALQTELLAAFNKYAEMQKGTGSTSTPHPVDPFAISSPPQPPPPAAAVKQNCACSMM